MASGTNASSLVPLQCCRYIWRESWMKVLQMRGDEERNLCCRQKYLKTIPRPMFMPQAQTPRKASAFASRGVSFTLSSIRCQKRLPLFTSPPPRPWHPPLFAALCAPPAGHLCHRSLNNDLLPFSATSPAAPCGRRRFRKHTSSRQHEPLVLYSMAHSQPYLRLNSAPQLSKLR